MGDLLNLAERCEKATGPDRELDLYIQSYLREGVIIPENRLGSFRDGFEPMESVWPRYTASLDAAALLADGYFKIEPDSLRGWRALGKMGPWCHASTPALALCAAALRARAAC